MIWAGIWGGLKQVPRWVWYGLLILMGLWALRSDARRSGREREQLKQERRENEIRQKAEAHVREAVSEERERADEAQATGGSDGPRDSRSMSDEEFYRTFRYRRTPREVDY